MGEVINYKSVVIEWSVSQGCFHSYSLRNMLDNNLGVCIRGFCTDYIPIGIFETEEESHEFMKDILPSLKKRADRGKIGVADFPVLEFNPKQNCFHVTSSNPNMVEQI